MHRTLTIRAIQQAMVHQTAHSPAPDLVNIPTRMHCCALQHTAYVCEALLRPICITSRLHRIKESYFAFCPCSGTAVLQVWREGVMQAPTVGVGVLAVAGCCCCECCRDGGYQSMLAAGLAIKQERLSACLACCCNQEQQGRMIIVLYPMVY